MRIRPTAAWALVTATALTAPLLAAGPAAAAHQPMPPPSGVSDRTAATHRTIRSMAV